MSPFSLNVGTGVAEAIAGTHLGGPLHGQPLEWYDRTARVGNLLTYEAACGLGYCAAKGYNPTLGGGNTQPGGLEWHGSGPPESGRGSWVDPATEQGFYGHMDSPTHGPHWDWMTPEGDFRIYPDGTIEPKVP